MRSSRWILLAAAVLLLLGAGGTAWRVAEEKSKARSGDGKSSRVGSGQGDLTKSSRPSSKKKSGSTFASLPPHLQKLVQEFGERGLFMMEREFTHGEFLAARAEAALLIEDLKLEDILKLIEFYQHTTTDYGDGFDLVDQPLFKRWGTLDPEGALAAVTADIQQGLNAFPDKIDIYDPFGKDGMRFMMSEIEAVFEGWASTDPEAALKGWEGIHGTLKEHPSVEGLSRFRGLMLRAISRSWSEHAPKEAWDFLEDTRGAPERDLVLGFASGLSGDTPWQWLASEVDDSPTIVPRPWVASQWARFEPEAALAWMRERDPENLPHLYSKWHRDDHDGQAIAWLRSNSATLPVEERLIGFRSALEARPEHYDELMPLLDTLPRNELTWRFVLDAAKSNAGDPFATNPFNGPRLRRLVNSLQPPQEVRQELEQILASRPEPPEDPFAP